MIKSKNTLKVVNMYAYSLFSIGLNDGKIEGRKKGLKRTEFG